MQLKYFDDTDTLYIQLNQAPVIETRELNENIYIDFGQDGNVVSITLEHAMLQTDVNDFSFRKVLKLVS